MSRRVIALFVLSFAAIVVVAACQDYNLTPVGSTILQPGVKQEKLENITTADILFVIDESGSMQGEQDLLAANFDTFVRSLAKTNTDRVALGREALDFHIAITTTSIFQKVPAKNTTTYQNCTASDSGVTGQAYPDGDFVAAAGNPKVIHFTKDLPWSSWTDPNSPPAEIQTRIDQFRSNIKRGTCGSNQEQYLQGARRAIEKAIAGTQPGVAGEWPHPDSKLVVVIVGDEDDCSVSNPPPADYDYNNKGCDTNNPNLISLQNYTDYFDSLGRPFGAAFIVSTKDGTCNNDDAGATCEAGICCAYWCTMNPEVCTSGNKSPYCGGQGAGYRHIALANLLRQKYEVVVGSICDESFSKTLENIANLVKPVETLNLPSVPADGDITVVRIIAEDGSQRQVCTQATSDQDTTAGWWFVADLSPGEATPNCKGSSSYSSTPTRCIRVNYMTSCSADPGETYSAEYLGVVPPGGCSNATPQAAPSQSCATALGGTADFWWCYSKQSGGQGTCLKNTGS